MISRIISSRTGIGPYSKFLLLFNNQFKKESIEMIFSESLYGSTIS